MGGVQCIAQEPVAPPVGRLRLARHNTHQRRGVLSATAAHTCWLMHCRSSLSLVPASPDDFCRRRPVPRLLPWPSGFPACCCSSSCCCGCCTCCCAACWSAPPSASSCAAMCCAMTSLLSSASSAGASAPAAVASRGSNDGTSAAAAAMPAGAATPAAIKEER